LGILSERGQISIEFILIVTISLVYINFYVWEAVETASQTAVDIKAVADTKVSSMKLANALNEAATSNGDMKKTINIFLPENAMIACNVADPNNASIDYDVMVSHMQWNPDVFNCVEQFDAEEAIGWTCSSEVELLPDAAAGLLITGGCPAMNIPLFKQIVVERIGPAISVNWK
jgi:uncharacterized protein (UPF0333 family)